VSKSLELTHLGFSSEKQNPQIVENLKSGYERKGALDVIAVRLKQAL